MGKVCIEVADIFRSHGDTYIRRFGISDEQFKVMNMIKVCRTAVLGGHVDKCDHCSFERPSYNSCRNRHCPKCQTMAKEQWLQARRSELLPCGYFHLVFTLPHALNPMISINKEKLLSLLFTSAHHVLQCFADDPKWRLNGRIGSVCVLHTWSQTLMDHYHLHCLVPAGALSSDEKTWTTAGKRYLFGVKSLSKAFRRRYLDQLIQLHQKKQLTMTNETSFGKMIHELKKKDWIVYAKRPFAGPEQVLDYLGRYTHRVAISNHRLIALENGRVTFTYRDRADGNQKKRMTLDALEFIRRFLLHVLPRGFVKIRYFGFMAHRHKIKYVALIRSLISPGMVVIERAKETISEMMLRLTGSDITRCPRCGKGKMVPWLRADRLPMVEIYNSS
jgi:hypothetical protein